MGWGSQPGDLAHPAIALAIVDFASVAPESRLLTDYPPEAFYECRLSRTRSSVALAPPLTGTGLPPPSRHGPADHWEVPDKSADRTPPSGRWSARRLVSSPVVSSPSARIARSDNRDGLRPFPPLRSA